jgi:predicted RNA-binding Zn-ribbon protein involved in translation (DUF1610 family)
MPKMAKIPMRVIPEPPEGGREVVVARTAGSVAIKGTEGSVSFLCGNCRAILAKSIGPDTDVVHAEDSETGDFIPLYKVRDLVFKCKACGAFNEVAG